MKVYGHEVEPYTDEEFVAWAESRYWKLAKTMPNIPHFYTINYKNGTYEQVKDTQEVHDYYRAIATIRERGGDDTWWKGRRPKLWRYYVAGGYKYWACPYDRDPPQDHHHLNRTYADEEMVKDLREQLTGHREKQR